MMGINLVRRQILAASFATCGLAVWPSRAQSQALLGAMINVAGRNRMHSQRLARSYAQLSLDIESDAARRYLVESSTAASATLESLDLAAPNAGVRSAIKAASAAWKQYKAQLDARPDRAHLKEVNAAAEEFFGASNALTAALQDAANQKAAKLTNDAGAQRPRVMRLAKCYMLEQGGVSMASEMRTAKTQFEAVHAALEQAPETTGVIRAQLDLVKVQFGFIATAVDGANLDRSKFARAAVTTSERIVEMMDEVVKGYAQQVKV
jgi:nitrate/nitrite-specific signal transduction histidine kinase